MTEGPGTGRRVLVTGATSVVGDFLLERLARAGEEVHALSRSPKAAGATGIRWHRVEAGPGLPQSLPTGVSLLVHLAPLWALPPLMAPLAERGLARLVALSSTSRFSKIESTSQAERRVAQALVDAEQSLVLDCARRQVTWTLLRPTMIYGAERDANVSRIARFIRRFGFFPLAGPATGRRQPVHADDIAAACLAALDRSAAANRAYDLSGGSTLTYRELVEAVFGGLGRSPRILPLPLAVLRAALRLARHAPGLGDLTPEMADRMCDDLCFDHSDAARDLGFEPRAFSYPG